MRKPAPGSPIRDALDLVQLYADLDLRLIPSRPSAAQRHAGAAAGNVSPEVAEKIYLAMLQADEEQDAV
jgi:hypothetical protein